MEDAPHRWTRVLPPVLLCAILWGSAFPGIKMVYRWWQEAGMAAGVADYWCFAGLRFSLAGLMLLAVSRNLRREWRATSKRWLAQFALTQTFAQYLFFYPGMAHASGALGGILSSLGSFWWMLLAPVMTSMPWPRRRQWVAVAMGAAGVALATWAPGTGAGKPWLGTLLIGCSTLFGTLGLMEFRLLQPTMSATAATGFSLLGGGIGLLACGAGAWSRLSEWFHGPAVWMTVGLAFVSATAFSQWNALSTRHPVPLLAGYRFLIPLAGAVESVCFLGERPGWGLALGGGLVILGMWASQRWVD